MAGWVRMNSRTWSSRVQDLRRNWSRPYEHLDAEAVTRRLGGRWDGRQGSARCPAHEDKNPSITIANGDDGRLLIHCFAGCEFRDIMAALRNRGIFDGAIRPAFAPPPLRRFAADREDAKKRALVEREWGKTWPISGTLAEAYLRSRAIRCDLPSSLRFNPSCWHPNRMRLPAMVAKVERDGMLVAVHRTYLEPPGRKANLEIIRATLGSPKSGAVRLSDGPGPLIVAEGLETTLSVLEMNNAESPRVWCGLSAPGLAALELPELPSDLIIAVDGDPPGHDAAEKLANRAYALGWRVSFVEAPEGKDWNDVAVEDAR